MKLHCPTCNRVADVGDASRDEVFTCPCGREFRAVHETSLGKVKSVAEFIQRFHENRVETIKALGSQVSVQDIVECHQLKPFTIEELGELVVLGLLMPATRAHERKQAAATSQAGRHIAPTPQEGSLIPAERKSQAQRSSEVGATGVKTQQRPSVGESVPGHQAHPAKPMTDECICIRCGSRYELDDPVEAGYKMQCDNCARVMTVGRFFGKHYAGVLKRSVERPRCPSCDSQDSTCGRKVLIGFTSPDLYLRQCNQCHAVWMGNSWYLESRVG